MDGYTVKTESFEGPLDLLLSLIEKRKLFINDISLAKVSDDFIGYLQQHVEFPLHEAAHFVLVASTLLLIKSKSLLPTLSLSEEEEESIEELEHKLALYKRIRDLSVGLRERFGRHPLFFRAFILPEKPVFAPPKKLLSSGLLLSIRAVLKALPLGEEKLPQTIVRKVISLEEMINRLIQRVQGNLSMSFKDFSGVGKEAKITVVVGFLAMLELVKRGIIEVEQERSFSDIHMTSNTVDIPRYNI